MGYMICDVYGCDNAAQVGDLLCAPCRSDAVVGTIEVANHLRAEADKAKPPSTKDVQVVESLAALDNQPTPSTVTVWCYLDPPGLKNNNHLRRAKKIAPATVYFYGGCFYWKLRQDGWACLTPAAVEGFVLLWTNRLPPYVQVDYRYTDAR